VVKIKNKSVTLSYQALYKKSEDFLKKILKENLPGDSKIFLFGSRAVSEQSKSSDIDSNSHFENCWIDIVGLDNFCMMNYNFPAVIAKDPVSSRE